MSYTGILDKSYYINVSSGSAPDDVSDVVLSLYLPILQFEETYQAMLTAFQLFDFLNDSFISKIDFRRVLMEFGFNIAPAELDHFLKRYLSC